MKTSLRRACVPIASRSGFVVLALGGCFGVVLLARAADETPLVTFGGRPPPVAAPVAVPDWAPPVMGAPIEAELPKTPVPEPSQAQPPPLPPDLSQAEQAPAQEETSVAAEPGEKTTAPAITIEGSAEEGEHAETAQDAQASISGPLRFIVRGNRSLPLETIRAALQPFLLSEAARQQVRAARAALQSAYAEAGREWVRVHVFEDAAPGAPVVFEVAETKLRSFHLVPLGVEAIAAVRVTLGDAATSPLHLRVSRHLRATPPQ